MGTVYKMLCMFQGEGPWEGSLSRAGVQIRAEQDVTPPCCCSPPSLLAFFLTRSLSGSIWKQQLPSPSPLKHRSDNACDTTKNGPDTAPSWVDRAPSLIHKWRGKRSRSQSFLQLVDPEPQGPWTVQLSPHGIPNPQMTGIPFRCGKGTKKCIWPEPKMSSSFFFCCQLFMEERGRKVSM